MKIENLSLAADWMIEEEQLNSTNGILEWKTKKSGIYNFSLEGTSYRSRRGIFSKGARIDFELELEEVIDKTR